MMLVEALDEAARAVAEAAWTDAPFHAFDRIRVAHVALDVAERQIRAAQRAAVTL